MSSQSTTNKNDRQAGPSQGRQQPQQSRGRHDHPRSATSQNYLERGNQQLREMVEDHEGQTVLVALAFGFAVGLVIGYSFGGPSEPERWTDRIAAEGIGRRFLERIDSLLPESITKKFG
jgi:hypothetical protein